MPSEREGACWSMRSRRASSAALSGPVEGLRAHLVLLGDRVLPKGDPQLPHPTLDLTLRSTHESKRSEILGFVFGILVGAAEGPVLADRP